MTKLTTKEFEALKGIVNSDFRDGDHPVGKAVWTWSANPFGSKRTFSGVVASLNTKWLTNSVEDGKDSVITMTAAGWEALKAVDPEYCAKIEENAFNAPVDV